MAERTNTADQRSCSVNLCSSYCCHTNPAQPKPQVLKGQFKDTTGGKLGGPVTMRFRVLLSIQETSCHLESTMPLLSSYNHTGFRWSAASKVCGHTSCGHLWIHQFHPESPPARWFIPTRHCKWEQNFAWHSTNPTNRNDNLQNPQEGNPGLERERYGLKPPNLYIPHP
jgi:hypothetical protein